VLGDALEPPLVAAVTLEDAVAVGERALV